MARSNEIIAKVVSIQSSGDLGDIANVDESGRTEGSMLIYNLISQQYELTSDISGKLDHISGVATSESAVVLDNNLHIDVINVGALTIDTSGGSATPLTSISTTLSAGSLDTQLPTALAVENRIQEVDASNVVTSIDENSTDTGKPTALAVENRIQAVAGVTISTTVDENSTDTDIVSGLAVETRIQAIDALNVVTSIDENSTDTGKPTALAVENRIQAVNDQNTHTSLSNNSGTQRDLSAVISTLGNSKILILDDIASGDSLNLDSNEEGLEYVIINTSSNSLVIKSPGVLTLVDGTGATSIGDRTLAISGICTVIRDNSPSVSNWVIFGNAGLS